MALELLTAARHLACVAEPEELVQICLAAGLDVDGSLDFYFFLRLMATCRDREIAKLQEALGPTPQPPLEAEVQRVLQALGHCPDSEQVAELLNAPAAAAGANPPAPSLDRWIDLLNQYKRSTAEHLQTGRGFSPAERQHLTMVFHKPLGLGGQPESPAPSPLSLTEQQLATLMLKEFPRAWRTTSSHPRLQQRLQGFTRGLIDFDGFLKAARFAIDAWRWQQAKRVALVIDLAGFGSADVQVFRSIFSKIAGASGTVSQSSFCKLVTSVVGGTVEHAEARLLQIIDSSKERGLDFADFLLTLRTLQEEDWCDINNACAAFVRDEQSSSSIN